MNKKLKAFVDFFKNLPLIFWLVFIFLILLQILILHFAGQPYISKSGKIMLWTSEVVSAENSQQIFDWYTFSHIIHGFLFYWIYKFLFPRQKIWVLALFAICTEMAWEILENSPFIINKYREATIAVGYSGDSILNSVSDVFCAFFGFVFAALNRWKLVFVVLVIFEVMCFVLIRDNLTLNILMLGYPIDIVRSWQSGVVNFGFLGI